MAVLIVASDAEGVGKTALCATLAHLLGRKGVRVAVRKPIAASGLAAAADPDPRVYADLLGQRSGSAPLDAPSGELTAETIADVESRAGERRRRRGRDYRGEQFRAVAARHAPARRRHRRPRAGCR